MPLASAENPYEAEEQQMLDLINQEREKYGLEPLVFNPLLNQVASDHSQEMIEKDYFSHNSYDGTSFFTRVRDSGYVSNTYAENIAWRVPPSVERAHEGLMNSPGHRANILNSNFNEIGIGIWVGEFTYNGRTYTTTGMYTQNFGWNNNPTEPTEPNQPPVANAGGPYNGIEGQEIIFNGSLSTDADGTIISYKWDFDYDGVNFDVDATGMAPVHTYFQNDAYTVALKVTDNDGASDTTTRTTTIDNVAPTVDAGVDQTVDEGDTVFFSGSFTDPGRADTHTIEWNFGDGAIVSGTLTPTHTYTDNGVYTVTLTVTDDDGAFTSDTLTVTVNQPTEPTEPTQPIVPPEIEVAYPSYNPESVSGDVQNFYITTSEPCDITWFVDGIKVKKDIDVELSVYETSIQSAGTCNVKVTIENENGADSKEWTWTITPQVGFDPMSYDTNSDGIISKPEVQVAIIDYFNDKITKPELVEVIMIYFNGN